MRILVLGGTRFLGLHIVEAALAAGHDVTIFNRGSVRTEFARDVEQLIGDRDGDLNALAGKSWDAVVDTSGYFPRQVKATAELLKSAAGQYLFISTISVYADHSMPGMDENAPLATIDDPDTTSLDTNYGPLKGLCEKIVESNFPGKSACVRPGLIVGPNDPTDRFTYWPHRIAEGGTVLVPGKPERLIQFIDVRDLALWCVKLIANRTTGTFNAAGPQTPLTMGDFVAACKRVCGGNAEFFWVTEQALVDELVSPWKDIPLWLLSTGDHSAMLQINCSRALDAGLTFRALDETIWDTLKWHSARQPQMPLACGLPREREDELIAKFKTR